MNVAVVHGGSRYAVGALALAALAVSVPAKSASPLRAVLHTQHVAVLGDAVIVGIPEYELVQAELARVVGELSHCFPREARVALYAHAIGGRIDDVEWVSADADIARCAASGLRARARLPVDDELSLMVPITTVD